MDHRALQCFVALAEELHFGRAAGRANIGQPGLSGQIRRLEEKLGATLFVRSSRKVSLTFSGQTLLEPARRALSALDELRLATRALGGTQAPHLTVGCTSIAAFWGAHRFINAFAEQHQGLVMETREMSSIEQESSLMLGEIDAGFLHPPFSSPLDHVEIAREPLVAAAAAGSALAAQEAVTLADLAREPLILFPRGKGPDLFGRIMSAFATQGLKPRLSKFANPFTVGIAAVAEGRGVALVTASYQNYRTEEVCYRRILDCDVSVPIALAWRSQAKNGLTQELVQAVRTTLANADQ